MMRRNDEDFLDAAILSIGTNNLAAFIATRDADYGCEVIDVVSKYGADLDTVYALGGFVREAPDSDLFINLQYTERDLTFLQGNRSAVAALGVWKALQEKKHHAVPSAQRRLLRERQERWATPRSAC